MILGSLLDAGLKIEDLKQDLSLLGLDGFEIRAEKTSRRHLSATSFFVDATSSQPKDRRLHHILDILDGSGLSASVREAAASIFKELADVEAAIHSTTPDKIHFHEVGAIDAIVDIVGALAGLERLGIDEVNASPVNVGGGFVECRHGVLPVPAPAAMKLQARSLVGNATPALQSGENTLPPGAYQVSTPSGLRFPCVACGPSGPGR